MPHHSYSYYDNVSPVPYVVLLVFFAILLSTVISLIGHFRLNNTKIGRLLASKVFLNPFFVSVTVNLAQILFGSRAVKLKKRGPTSILVIKGRHYELNGFTSGSIAYYNFITICIIIFVSLQFMIRNTAWSVKECQSGADCFYLNYSAIPPDSYSQDDPPAIPIENCTLEETYDEEDVTCYTIGFHPAVELALLGGFLNIVTLLFAFCVGIQVKIFGKTIKKLHDDKMRGKSNHYSYKFQCRLMKIFLCYMLFIFTIFGLSIAFVILVYLNYETPKDRQNSFEKMFSSEPFVGQSIAFCVANFLFYMYPVMFIEKYPATPAATQNIMNNEDDREDDSKGENRNETVFTVRGASRSNRSYGTLNADPQ